MSLYLKWNENENENEIEEFLWNLWEGYVNCEIKIIFFWDFIIVILMRFWLKIIGKVFGLLIGMIFIIY